MSVNGGYRVQHISPGKETNFQHGVGRRSNNTTRNRHENEAETRAQKLQYEPAEGKEGCLDVRIKQRSA